MTKTRRNNAIFWTVQALVALTFLFAGGMKLALPLAALKGPIVLPGAFVRFLGVAEVSGALGLLLPGIFGVKRYLTPVAAIGLVLIMSGATTITIEGGMPAVAAVIPAIIGTLAGLIAYGRRDWIRESGAEPMWAPDKVELVRKAAA